MIWLSVNFYFLVALPSKQRKILFLDCLPFREIYEQARIENGLCYFIYPSLLIPETN